MELALQASKLMIGHFCLSPAHDQNKAVLVLKSCFAPVCLFFFPSFCSMSLREEPAEYTAEVVLVFTAMREILMGNTDYEEFFTGWTWACLKSHCN